MARPLLLQVMLPANPCFQVEHRCAVLQDEQIFPMSAHPTVFVATAATSTVMTVQTRPGKVQAVFICVPRGLEKRAKMWATRKVSERLRLKPPSSITRRNCCKIIYGVLGWHEHRIATNLDYSQNSAKLTHCDDGSYCCGVRNTTCCAQGHGKRIANIIEIAHSSSSSFPGTAAGSGTLHPSGASTATAATSNARAGTSERHTVALSLKEQIAIAVSCVIIGTLVAAFIVWSIMRRKERAGSDDTAKSKGTANDKVSLATSLSPSEIQR